jgi:N utilization substance protein A
MQYISLFESVTGATVKDCIIDDKSDRIIFLIKAGDLGLAIGKHGSHINLLRNMTKKNVEVIEHAEDPAILIKNALAPARVKDVRITERTDGKKVAFVVVEPRDKGIAIGKNGRTAERTRFLAKRYFEIDHVIIA